MSSAEVQLRKGTPGNRVTRRQMTAISPLLLLVVPEKGPRLPGLGPGDAKRQSREWEGLSPVHKPSHELSGKKDTSVETHLGLECFGESAAIICGADGLRNLGV